MKAALKIPSLDGLRAVSFGIVFASHSGLNHAVPGAFGVTVFFFLSGYLITTLLRLEQEATGTLSLKHFYLRRILRIHPPFYLVLGLAMLATLAGIAPGSLDAGALLAQALHYANYRFISHGYGGVPAGTGVYWSLAVEEHFYLVFPWLYLLLVRLKTSRRAQAQILGALCVLLLAWRFYLLLVTGANHERTGIGSDTRFDSLLFGCALALYGNPALDSSRLSERTWKLLLPVGLAGLLLSFVYRDEVFRETYRYTLQGVSLIPVFVCAIRYPSWWPIRPLNAKIMGHIGLLSYSLYLIHLVVIYALEHHFLARLGPLSVSALALTISLLLAEAMYQLVERPCARLRHRLQASAPKPRPGPAETTSAA